MKIYNRGSIRARLKFVILLMCVFTIGLVFTGFYIYEVITSKERLINDISTKADIISENINAALIFRDTGDALSVLNSLKSQESISGAAVYDNQGNIFVTYTRWGKEMKFPATPAERNFYENENEELAGFKPIVLDNNRIGTLYISMDLTEQRERSSSYLKIALFVMMGTLLIAYFVTIILSKNISAPIVNLSNTAELIAKQEDFTIRAEKKTKDETGKLVDSFNVMLDKIMERDRRIRNANISLQSAERRYRTTLDNMIEGCQIIGKDWKYQYLNKEAIKQSRNKAEKLIGYKIQEIYPGIEKTELFEHMQRCMDSRIPHTMENEFKYPNGETSWFKLNLEPVPEGIFILSVDITEEKLLQEEVKKYHENLEELVKQRTAQLEDANKELESFSYSVSHDLRAPIRHISGFLDILQKNILNTLDDKSKRYFGLIREATKEMGMLIDDLLTFSRTARADLSFRKINMNDLIEEEIEKLKPDFENRNIKWNVSELPEFKGDYHLLKIVFSNLISNAIKFTSARDEAIIKIGGNETGETVTIFVNDNGSGFDMKYYDKLFGVFQRLHSTTDFPGTGIGLATVKKIINKHGGEVWAAGKEDEGATFYVSLSKEKKESDGDESEEKTKG